jgi:hypothetical protein
VRIPGEEHAQNDHDEPNRNRGLKGGLRFLFRTMNLRSATKSRNAAAIKTANRATSGIGFPRICLTSSEAQHPAHSGHRPLALMTRYLRYEEDEDFVPIARLSAVRFNADGDKWLLVGLSSAWLNSDQDGKRAWGHQPPAIVPAMYGPPSDCKGKANSGSTDLRKCIRPFCGEWSLLAMMSCAACSS